VRRSVFWKIRLAFFKGGGGLKGKVFWSRRVLWEGKGKLFEEGQRFEREGYGWGGGNGLDEGNLFLGDWFRR
jgi:hypothetical protein